MTKDDALKLALEVLENLPGFRADIDNAITAIKEALAQPQRPWVGLTAEEATKCWTISAIQTWFNFENALRIKNT
jgi:hypothetical protein